MRGDRAASSAARAAVPTEQDIHTTPGGPRWAPPGAMASPASGLVTRRIRKRGAPTQRRPDADRAPGAARENATPSLGSAADNGRDRGREFFAGTRRNEPGADEGDCIWR
jgi:hypothetical protein